MLIQKLHTPIIHGLCTSCNYFASVKKKKLLQKRPTVILRQIVFCIRTNSTGIYRFMNLFYKVLTKAIVQHALIYCEPTYFATRVVMKQI